MKMDDYCLPELMDKIVKMAHIAKVENKDKLYQQMFAYLSHLDFHQSKATVFGETLQRVEKLINNDDPYLELKNYYYRYFIKRLDDYHQKIDSLDQAIFYATIANIMEENPIHNHDIRKIVESLENSDDFHLSLNHSSLLKEDLKRIKSLLYMSDNVGEAFFDYLLIQKIKTLYPNIHIYYAVRGCAIENDCTLSDIEHIPFQKYATVIDNGDNALGTVLSRVSPEFLDIYDQVDLVISKGQANYESLCEEDKEIYFLMMVNNVKIARHIGVENETYVCMKKETEESVSFSFCI